MGCRSIRPISQIDRQRTPDRCYPKTSLFGEKEKKNTREFSWTDQTRRYYETAIASRARIFLIPLASVRAESTIYSTVTLYQNKPLDVQIFFGLVAMESL